MKAHFFYVVLILIPIRLFAQDFWKSIGPVENGIVTRLAIDSNHNLFAAYSGNGLYKSTDYGATWIKLNTGTMSNYIDFIGFDTKNNIYTGTEATGIFRSTDHGESWTAVNNGLTNLYGLCFAVNKTNNHIFIGTREGVFRSTNEGDSWEQVNSGLLNTYILSIAANSKGDIFAGTIMQSGGGVFRTTDDGNSWLQINNGLPYATNYFSLVVDSKDVIYAGTYQTGIFRSSDNGENWTEKNHGLPEGLAFIQSLAINSEDYLLAGTRTGFFLSRDHGENWIELSSGLSNKYIQSLAVDSGGDIFAGSNGGGLYKSPKFQIVSPNGGEHLAANSYQTVHWIPNVVAALKLLYSTDGGQNWNLIADNINASSGSYIWGPIPNSPSENCLVKIIDQNNPEVFDVSDNKFSIYEAQPSGWYTQAILPDYNLRSVFFINKNIGWAASTNVTPIDPWSSQYSAAVFKTLDGGITWSKLFDSSNVSLKSIFFINQNIGWVAGGGRIFKTTDGGTNWVNQPNGGGIINYIYFTDENNGFCVGGQRMPDIAGGTLGYFLRTTDGGEHWITQNQVRNISYEAIYFINDSTGWLLNSDGMGILNGINKTVNRGITWEIQKSSPTILTSIYFIDENFGWAGGLNGTFCKTTNGGNNWTNINLVGIDYVNTIYFYDRNQGWIGTDKGIYKTTDGGLTWEKQFDDNITLINFIDNQYGWAINNGYSTIYHTTDGGLTFLENKKTYLPDDFILLQNYPNPFNPSTTINYSIPKTSFVSLKVYDILGKEVASLVNEEKPAGNYEVKFNGNKITSGIYLYKIQAGNYSSVKKMILIK